MSMSSFSAVSRTSRGGSRSELIAVASCSAIDSVVFEFFKDENRGPAERHADRVGDHVEDFEGAIVGHALQELEPDSHEDKAHGVHRARPGRNIGHAKKKHQQAIGGEMAELVALLEVDLRRLRHERKPDDRDRPAPAGEKKQLSLQKSAICPPASFRYEAGTRNRLQ